MTTGRRVMTPGRGVLDGAFLVLEELAERREAGLGQLSAATGLPKSTVHRLLEQLTVLGAVRRQGKRYRVGARMFRLGSAWDTTTLLRSVAREPLRRLAALAGGASVNIAVPDNGRTLLVCGVPGEVDEIAPVHAGALAPHGNAGDRLFATDATPPPPGFSGREWTRLVQDVRATGLAFDRENFQPGVSVVAAPVRGGGGQVVAGVGVLVRDGRRLSSLAALAHRTAELVGVRLRRVAPGFVPG